MDALTGRASSLSTLFDCPARWAAVHIEGRQSPSSGRAYLGTSIHHATGLFDQSVIEGDPITEADAVAALRDMINKPEEEVDWSDLQPSKAISLGALLTNSYCQDIAPFREYEAVELQCNPLTIKVKDVKVTLTGHADRVRIVELPLGPNQTLLRYRGISDIKSGARIVNSAGEVDVKKHAAQLGVYELIGIMVEQTANESVTAPAEIVALPTAGKAQRAIAETVEKPSRILLGDGAKNKGLLEAMATMAKSENFYGNPNSQLCSNRYCPIYPCWWTGR